MSDATPHPLRARTTESLLKDLRAQRLRGALARLFTGESKRPLPGREVQWAPYPSASPLRTPRRAAIAVCSGGAGVAVRRLPQSLPCGPATPHARRRRRCAWDRPPRHDRTLDAPPRGLRTPDASTRARPRDRPTRAAAAGTLRGPARHVGGVPRQWMTRYARRSIRRGPELDTRPPCMDAVTGGW